MVSARTERLVVVGDASRYEAVVDDLRRRVAVTQLLPPRLAVIEFPAAAVAPEHPDATLYAGAPASSVVNRLTRTERLFIAAWLARRGGDRPAGQHRRGEGLDWDAPGFEPPDRPDAPHGS